MNYFDHLPPELISLIGDYIHKKDIYTCLFINKTFYKAILPIIWKRLDVRNQDIFSEIDLPHHSSCGKFVKEISFGSFLTDPLLEEWIQYVPFLTHIEFIHYGGNTGGITDIGFQHVVEYCPHLTHVYIRGTRVTQQSIMALGQYCHQLRLIELQYLTNQNDDDDDLFSALVTCTFLETLVLTRCDTDDTNLVKLMELEHLTTLIIEDASFDLTPIFTTSVTCCPRLTHLDLYPCSTLTDSMIIPFLQTHPYLTHLELLSSQITDLTLDAITMYLPEIKTLGLDYNVRITPNGVRRLVKQCPTLMLMTTFGCQIVSDDFPEANEMYFELEDDDLLHVTQFEEEELEEIRSGFFDDDD